MTDAPLKIPPSKNKWKARIFTLIGAIKIAASAIRFKRMRTMLTAKTDAIRYIMYPVLIRISMSAQPSGVVYISAVGAGKTPRVPKIGITRRRTSKTLRMMFKIFIKSMGKYVQNIGNQEIENIGN